MGEADKGVDADRAGHRQGRPQAPRGRQAAAGAGAADGRPEGRRRAHAARGQEQRRRRRHRAALDGRPPTIRRWPDSAPARQRRRAFSRLLLRTHASCTRALTCRGSRRGCRRRNAWRAVPAPTIRR
ncbi:MAG: hypothetical protein MZW92_42245 [Comamonadaceae bacterium]|nr:hypothetical protein [Comamonadaceae bacterium]